MRHAARSLAALVALACAPAVNAQVFTDGFETYSATTTFQSFAAGTTLGSTWSVYDPVGGTPNSGVDVVRVGWNPAGQAWTGVGNHSLDLNALGRGAIATEFAATVGQQYQVSFLYGGNMLSSGGSREFAVGLTGAASGSVIGATTFDNPSFALQSGSFLFTADAGNVSLRFNSRVDGNAGAILDNVVVTAVPEPHEWAMMLAGLGIVGWAARRARRDGTGAPQPAAA